MKSEADTKIEAVVEGLKSNLFEGGTPPSSEESSEKKALGTFETSQPFSEEVILRDKVEEPKEPQRTPQEAQASQEEADRVRFRRGYRAKPSYDESYVQELAIENRALQERLEYNNQFHHSELARLQAEVAFKNKTTQDLEKHSLKLKEEYLVAALMQAKEEGDYAAEAKLQRSLSAVHADLSTADYRYQAKSQAAQPYTQRYNPPPPPQRVQPTPRRPEFEAWIDQNPWFEEGSPDHNPELVQEVMDYARNLNKTLQVRGLSHQIDSAGYYEVLDAMIKNKYAVSEDYEEPEKSPETRRPRSVVSSVPRGDNSGGGIPVNGTSSVYLTPEQKEMALSRTKVHPNGTPYTQKELLQSYAQIVAKLDQHDKDYGIPNNPYKTTLKFGG